MMPLKTTMLKNNEDGSKTTLTLPNRNYIKASTLRIICVQSKISREDFINAYEKK